MDSFYQLRLDCSLTPIWIAASEAGVVRIAFREEELALPGQRGSEVAQHIAESCREQLLEYFAGRRQEFTIPLDLRCGTPFQRECWQVLQSIGYGKTKSYQEIAREIGRPQACRAVGQANHHNPIAIVIPCHRVITSSGDLGGYGGGLRLKQYLLELEGAMSSSPGQQKLEFQIG